MAKTDALLFNNLSSEEKAIFKSGIDKLFATINTLPDPEYIVHAIKKTK